MINIFSFYVEGMKELIKDYRMIGIKDVGIYLLFQYMEVQVGKIGL